jgi:hypothetical protein
MNGKSAKISDKEIVQHLLNRMPDGASIDDIAKELEFITAVRRGMSQLDENKDSISIERVEPKFPSWIVTVGRKRRGRQKRKAGDSFKSPAHAPRI